MPVDEFDTLVDATVREMLDVEPRADLRARVLDKISLTTSVASAAPVVASAFRRKIRFRRKILIAAPLAAAAMLLLALWPPVRRMPVTDVAAPKQVRVVEPPFMQAPVTQPSSFAPPSRDIAYPATSGPRSIASGASSARAVDAPELPPLHQIAPIDVAAVTTPSIAPKEITVEPLAPIAEVEIAPLNPPDRRN